LYPFEVAIREAGARSVMPSYNEVDGVPSHANQWLLHDVLRGEWRFDGVIVSDWFAISQLADLHHVAADHAEGARRALAARGGILPLSVERLSRVAVIGPHAAEVLLGGYSGGPRHLVSILEGIRTRLGPRATVEYAEGTRITEDSTFTREPQPHVGGTRSHARWGADRVVLADSASNVRRRAAAVALARRSQVAIVVVGDNEMTSREAYAPNHLGDRADLGLPGEQEELVRAVLATGTRTVLVLIHGRPLSIPALVARGPAILDGWYLGQETGTAV